MNDRIQEYGDDGFATDQERKEHYDSRIAKMKNKRTLLEANWTEKKLEEAQACIEAVKWFEKRKHNAGPDSFARSFFPELDKKYHHNQEIYQMCIDRMWSRYDRVMSTIKAGR